MRKVFEIVGATATAVALFIIVSSFFDAIKKRDVDTITIQVEPKYRFRR